MPRKLLISGHRGYHDKELDNTKKAFQRAIDEGIDYIEFDVKKSKDGIPIIFHDRTVDNLTNASGNIESFTLDELRKIEYKDGQKFQTLKEMFDQCAGKISLMLEIKSDDIEIPIMDLVKLYKIEKSLLIQSFKPKHIENCYKYYPHEDIKWGLCQAFLGNLGRLGKILGLNKLFGKLIYNKFLKPYPYIKYLNLDGPFICDAYIEIVREKGLHIILGAMNTWKYIDKYEDWFVEILNCNNPRFCVEEIKKNAPHKYIFSETIKY